MGMKRKILSQEALKVIACLAMLIDHFGAAIVVCFQMPFARELYYACRIIGRIAFPIFAFLLCEGMHHTRNPVKYISRLAVGILLAELPFDFLFKGGVSWASQSVMVTLTLAALMLYCMAKTERKEYKLLMALPFALFAELVCCDYGGWGIAMVAVFALIPQLPWQILGIAIVNLLMNSARVPFLGIGIPVQLFAIPATVPIAMYSGRKQTHNRVVQWAFYLFYPVHLLILWIITLLLG